MPFLQMNNEFKKIHAKEKKQIQQRGKQSMKRFWAKIKNKNETKRNLKRIQHLILDV